MPQNAFFLWTRSLLVSEKMTQRHFIFTLHPLSTVFFATATVLTFVLLRSSSFNFHCYTQREATPIQKSARKCAATSCDFFAERLQSVFTLANQLCWIAQYCPSITYNRNIGKWNMWKNAGSWGLYYWILTMSHSLIQRFIVCESEQKYFCSCLKCSLIINSYSNK